MVGKHPAAIVRCQQGTEMGLGKYVRNKDCCDLTAQKPEWKSFLKWCGHGSMSQSSLLKQSLDAIVLNILVNYS